MQTEPWSRLALLAMLLMFPLTAAGREPRTLVLGWSEIAAAVERQPATLEAAARERAAAGALSTAREVPNPTFGLSAGHASPAAGGPSRTEWGVSVEMPLDFIATRSPRVAAAAASQESMRGEAGATRVQVLKELRRSFVALAHHQAAVEAGAELEKEVSQLASLVRRRVERGESRPTEVPRIEVELERHRSALHRARAVAEAERKRLSTWLGAPVDRVAGELEKELPLPPLDQLRDDALAKSPIVRASRARADAAAEQASAERWERFPKFSLGAAHTEELDRKASTITANVSFPLWNWSSGRVQQAEAAAEGERARLAAASRDLTVALSDAWQSCATGQATARRFREQILPRAADSARTLGRAFELGETGLFDVIDARRVLLEARREYLDVLLDMQNACADVAVLAGLELP